MKESLETKVFYLFIYFYSIIFMAQVMRLVTRLTTQNKIIYYFNDHLKYIYYFDINFRISTGVNLN